MATIYKVIVRTITMKNQAPENYCTACPHCKADLKLKESVAREYVNKDSTDPDDSVQALGHYENGEFESDSFSGFGDDRYDLLDDSDKCSACDGEI